MIQENVSAALAGSETMKLILPFVINHWPSFASVVAGDSI